MVSVRELDRFLVLINCQQDRLLVIIDKVINNGFLLVILFYHDCTIRTKFDDLTWLVIDLPASQDARCAGYQITPGQAE